MREHGRPSRGTLGGWKFIQSPLFFSVDFWYYPLIFDIEGLFFIIQQTYQTDIKVLLMTR